MNKEQWTQVLRTIDKLDRVGVDGVRSLLTTGMKDSSGAFIPGCGLNAIQAELIISFITISGDTNQDILQKVKEWPDLVEKVYKRIELLSYLQETIKEDGRSAFDHLLDLPVNSDQTWNNGGRPEDLATMLDDVANILKMGC